MIQRSWDPGAPDILGNYAQNRRRWPDCPFRPDKLF